MRLVDVIQQMLFACTAAKTKKKEFLNQIFTQKLTKNLQRFGTTGTFVRRFS